MAAGGVLHGAEGGLGLTVDAEVGGELVHEEVEGALITDQEDASPGESDEKPDEYGREQRKKDDHGGLLPPHGTPLVPDDLAHAEHVIVGQEGQPTCCLRRQQFQALLQLRNPDYSSHGLTAGRRRGLDLGEGNVGVDVDAGDADLPLRLVAADGPGARRPSLVEGSLLPP